MSKNKKKNTSKNVDNNDSLETNDLGMESTSSKEEINDKEDIDSIKKCLTDAKDKADKNWELYLSAKAEVENIRKRSERDITNAHKYALDKFIPDLLTIKDALELGEKAAKETVSNENNEQINKFIEGSTMAIAKFSDVLKKFGVDSISPEGESFNPVLHQAITMVENNELPNNTVIEVIQKGYTLNDRLIRPSMVVVSKKE